MRITVLILSIAALAFTVGSAYAYPSNALLRGLPGQLDELLIPGLPYKKISLQPCGTLATADDSLDAIEGRASKSGDRVSGPCIRKVSEDFAGKGKVARTWQILGLSKLMYNTLNFTVVDGTITAVEADSLDAVVALSEKSKSLQSKARAYATVFYRDIEESLRSDGLEMDARMSVDDAHVYVSRGHEGVLVYWIYGLNGSKLPRARVQLYPVSSN